MDVTLLFTIASALIVLIFALALIKQRSVKVEEPPPNVRAPPGLRVQEGQIRRRAVAARNARARLRVAARNQQESDEDEAVQDENEEASLPEGKIGTKKRAKLEAKAEQKAHREAENKEREERKKREALLEDDRKKQEEKDKLDEEKRLQEEKRLKEEKEKKEYEEYLKIKEAFTVEEEGYEEGEEENSEQNLLQQFISYIKSTKSVVLEDLAAHFKIKTQNAIERIQDLQKEGYLTGVIDDRGKFIYISQEELEAVAKFVKQRGRVSIAELAENSNKLISLNPKLSVSASN